MMLRHCSYCCVAALLLLTATFAVATAALDPTSSIAFVAHHLRPRTRRVDEEATNDFGGAVVASPSQHSSHSRRYPGTAWSSFAIRGSSCSDVSETDLTTPETAPRDEEKKKKVRPMEVLVFGAKLNYTSDLFYANATQQEFVDFFETLETKNLLMGSGGKVEVKRLDATSELLELWKSSCQTYYGSKYLPKEVVNQKESNEIYASESIVSFPGIKVITTVCTAVIVDLAKDDGNMLPSYDFILIGENRKAEGPKPLIWLFNKLTGADKHCQEKRAFNPSQATAQTHVSVIRHQNQNSQEGADGNGGDIGERYGFNFDMKMEIRVEFPRALVKLLPTTREKIEEQMSASLHKAVQPNVVQAIAATRTSFLHFIGHGSSSSSSSSGGGGRSNDECEAKGREED